MRLYLLSDVKCSGLPSVPPSADAESSDVGVATVIDRGHKTGSCKGSAVPAGSEGDQLPSCPYAKVGACTLPTSDDAFKGQLPVLL